MFSVRYATRAAVMGAVRRAVVMCAHTASVRAVLRAVVPVVPCDVRVSALCADACPRYCALCDVQSVVLCAVLRFDNVCALYGACPVLVVYDVQCARCRALCERVVI